MESMKVKATQREILELNEKFSQRKLFGESFNETFERNGVDCKRSVLVKVIPEGSGTYTGRVIQQEGKVLKFDIDLEAADLSEWEDVTKESIADYERMLKARPWDEIVVAYQLFLACRNSDRPEGRV
jgi:hypothetical protein